MDIFITFLRAVACVVITNAHYEEIYPAKIFANGGLLGDVIFFAVSGYCVYNIKLPFNKWYSKRILRIFPVVWLVTVAYWIAGFYDIHSWNDAFLSFVYPTKFHFVGSIMVLYIIFYIVMSIDFLKNRLGMVILATAMAFLIYYISLYDKSIYAIDVVRNWEIRVLFFECMMLGAWFRHNRDAMMGKVQLWRVVPLALVFLCYMACKLALIKFEFMLPYQILNWVLLFTTLFLIFRFAIGMECAIKKMPKASITLFTFLSTITLEVYIVQYVLIPRLSHVGVFPLNFIIVTATILIFATIAHRLTLMQSVFLRNVVNSIKKRWAENLS